MYMDGKAKIELPIVVSIEDEDMNEDTVAHDKEREAQRAESRNAPSEGFETH